MKYTLMSRRRLLRSVSAASAGLPFLRKVPFSFAAAPNRRLLIFFTPNEPIEKKYWQPPGAAGQESKLTGLVPLMKPLEPFVQKLLLMGDLSMDRVAKLDKGSGGHRGIGWMLTGMPNIQYGPKNFDFWAGGPSVDQVIAKRLGVEALTLGAHVQGASGNGRISYSGANQPVHPIEDPGRAFDRTFAGVKPSAGEPDISIEVRREQKRMVLDAVNADLKSLKTKLPAQDVNKLDQHLEGIAALEKRLNQVVLSADCNPRPPRSVPAHTLNQTYPVISRLHMDVAVQALACNVTRVASVQLANTGAGHLTPLWPDDGIEISRDEHNIAHDYSTKGGAPEVQNREKLEAFYYRQFAYLLAQMDAIADGAGTLLDNTVVFWVKNISHDHRWNPMFFMIAGGGGGGLKTGRYLSFGGRSHNDLLASICHLMGLTDVQKFGHESVALQPVTL